MKGIPQNQPSRRYLRVTEAADYTGLSTSTLAKLRLRGNGPPFMKAGRHVGREYEAHNPRRADRRLGSFRINATNGRWADFATGDKGGDVVSLAAYLSGTGQFEAARALADMLGVRSHD